MSRQRLPAGLAVAVLLAGAAFAVSAATAVSPAAAAAAPAAGPWAEPRFRGYTGADWDDDRGVTRGRCRIDEVADAVGREGRVPTVTGELLADTAGARIGLAITVADRACVGLVVELLERGRAAHWQNPATSIAFTVRPMRDLDANCREIEFTASQRGRRSKNQVSACRDSDARWTIVR